MSQSTTVASGGPGVAIGFGKPEATPPSGGYSLGKFRFYVAPGFGRLWVASVFVPIIALILGGVWTWDNVVSSAEGQMRRTLDMVNGQVLRLLETQEAVMAGMQAFVAPMNYDEMLASEPAHMFAEKIAAAAETVITLGVVDPKGRITVPSEEKRPPPQVNLASRDYAQAWAHAPEHGPYRMFISPVVINEVIRRMEHRIQLQIHTSLPRFGADGKPDGGIVTAAFGPVQIERFFQQVAETPNTGFSILRDEGDLDHAKIVANYPVNLHVVGQNDIEPTNIAPDDIARGAILELNQSLAEPSAHLYAVKRETGFLFHNFQLVLVRRVGAEESGSAGGTVRKDYPLDIIHRLDPAVALQAWYKQMLPVLIGAVAAMALLLMLTSRAQATTLREQAELRTRTAIAEEGQRLATDRAELESRLRQTEKVAALGQLAAGVAHDFNNLLQTIILNGELLAANAGAETPQARSANLIIRASEGGIALTRRMLDYTRRDDAAAEDRPFDLAASLRNVQALLTSSLGARHRLRVSVASDLPSARGGDAEFESVIINLLVNARDAMEAGGEILVEATAVTLNDASRSDLIAGRYVRVSVIDTGKGMDAATLARAGEAFFTTKERGRGTGLGLSMARGFARRSGGALDLASKPGQGTTVTVWLPAA